MTDGHAQGSIPDLAERRRALDPLRSFIVQAPAGSGKTELLIQRYLLLLGCVDRPEEIAAITFTRKAAAEMRHRVLAALAAARSAPEPQEPHQALTWSLASRALQRDAALGWALEHDPSRLRIQTIDALCASLTRQMPVISAFGAQPESVEDASALYAEAARATLALVDEPGEAGEWAARLLAHLDNDAAVAEGLLADMLARRDHWMRNLGRFPDREDLERALRAECDRAVERVVALLPEDSPLRREAAGGPDGCRVLADRLLTREGQWRKRSGEAQALAGLGEQGEALREALDALRWLPPTRYTDEQWETLGIIMRLLPHAVAELQLVFAARRQADFVEVAQRALAALGAADAPTDLMLALDYRIRHLLVDEFQDTSFTQYRLLEKLTEGWQPQDGRTLFLVGDPMQSIYRFREAEVGLFLKARREGIGPVRPEPLRLSANFRSAADIVAWVNECFSRVLPGAEDAASGAVPYSPSVAVHPPGGEGVSIHPFFDGDAAGEASLVVSLVEEARRADPQGTIAVLVRGRPQLREIVPALRRAGLRFRAIEIEPLAGRQAVQDVLALTRALRHLADRAAWLAVLRAPWCGLTLADMHALAGLDGVAGTRAAAKQSAPAPAVADLFPETLAAVPQPATPAQSRRDERTIWELLHDPTRLAGLSDDGRSRAEGLRETLEPIVAARERTGLRRRVEAAWLGLGGPACIADDTELEDVMALLDHVQQHERGGDVSDEDLRRSVETLFALPDIHAEPHDVQILTIHKAKGLEFDTVIVPGLGAAPRRRDPRLFLWMERPVVRVHDADPCHGRTSTLLLAPIRRAGADRDPVYDYIARLDEAMERHEDGRLLYVAATRARKRLHLIGDTRLDRDAAVPEPRPPAAGSLLETLWQVVCGTFRERAAQVPSGAPQPVPAPAIDQTLRRLPAGWRLPALPPAPRWSGMPMSDPDRERIEFSWAGETARHVGSVVHRWLQRMAEEGLARWNETRIHSLRDAFRAQLASRGVPREKLAEGCDRVTAALVRTLTDPRGRWLLSERPDARNEYRLALDRDGGTEKLVVDRVFTDEQGVLWIVDYKTSLHEGADTEAFLDRERERYRQQLERYAAALAARLPGNARACRLGLYFPLLSGWREWAAGGAAA